MLLLDSGTIHFAHNLLGLLVQVLVRGARHARHGHTARDVLKGLAKVDAVDGDVGAALPRSVLGTVARGKCVLFHVWIEIPSIEDQNKVLVRKF